MVGFVYGLLVFCFSMFWLFSDGRRLAFKVGKSGCFGRGVGLGRDGVERCPSCVTSTIQSAVCLPGLEVFFALGGRGAFLLGAEARPCVGSPVFRSYFEC
jgi:hypothetical protein